MLSIKTKGYLSYITITTYWLACHIEFMAKTKVESSHIECNRYPSGFQRATSQLSDGMQESGENESRCPQLENIIKF